MDRLEVTRHVAARMRQLRQQRGWSALQLADACTQEGFASLTRSTIAKIESGVRQSITAEEIAVLARVFGVTPTDLMPTPAADPLPALLDDPQVPEHKRFCPNRECRHEVGRAREGRPGQVEGMCPQCGTRFSFRPPLAPGVLVGDGRFRVEGAIAHGGFAWVYRAWDCLASRWVVLKGLIDPDDPDKRQAAVAELAALADANHPNIVTVHTVVQHPHPLTGRNIDYIVMDYLSGKSLKQLYQERSDSDSGLPVDQVCEYGLAVLAALDYLHNDRGLLYCDLSADNVIHSTNGVKLIDLGAIRRIDDRDSPVWGKIGYRDPEMATHGPSVATDLYTVGRMMAVLSFPFPGFFDDMPIPSPNEVELLARYPSYYQLLRRATNPDPQSRFASAADMAEQLDGVLQEVRAQQEGRPSSAEGDADADWQSALSQARDVKSSLRHVATEVTRRTDVEGRALQPLELQPLEQYRSRTKVHQSPVGSGKGRSGRSPQSSIGLVVGFQGRQVAVLRPGNPPFTFGRGHDRTLRFGHDSVNGGPDLHISRNVGSIQYSGGLWVVCNDSGSRPFDVIVRGVSSPLPPRTASDAYPRWAVSPPGLEIQVGAPSGRYLLSIRLDDPRQPLLDPLGHEDPGTISPREPTEHERLLLAAKFLALPDPGDAVGNLEAAEYASSARPQDPPVTERAVDNCVVRWCSKLQELGVTGISGRDNINRLGRQLLAWGLLRQEDRQLLHPVAGG